MSGGAGQARPACASAASVTILFVDEELVVVDKPAGMPSVPARTPLDPPCVASVLADRLGALEAVHRLDRDTSGVLVLARTAAARAALGRAFEARQVRKRYEAVVCGRPTVAEGVVHLPLARDPDRPPRYRVDPILGRAASSRWWLVATAVAADGRPRSWLELEPVTGRSHQLRVHLAWLGLPIQGDRLYGPSAVGADTWLGLRSAWLSLPHPCDGRVLEFTAAPPTWWPRAPMHRPAASSGRTGPDP